jgi:hypothetical protein
MGRPLSYIEKTIWVVDLIARQNFVMVARVSGTLTEPVLRQALDLVQAKHPPLRWKIKESDPPEFVLDNVPKIPLRIIERKGDDHWIEEAEKEIDGAFPFTEGPFVRVVQLVSKDKEECDLLVSFCHIASDATSGVTIVNELLTIAGKLARGETVVPEAPLAIPPSSADALRKDLEFPPDPGLGDEEESVELTPDVNVPPEERVTRIIFRTLSQSETKKLVAKCREQDTSVHGALCAAFFQAVMGEARKSPDVPDEGPLMISCLTPVGIRHLFTQSLEQDVGYYITFALHRQRIDENASLWNEARKVKQAIQEEVKYGRDIKAILNFGDFVKSFSNPIDLVREINSSNPPVVATNMGRLNIPEQFGDLKLQTLHYPVALHFDAKSGFSFSVTTFRGIMNIDFLYSDPYISRERAVKMVDDTMKRLKNALG